MGARALVLSVPCAIFFNPFPTIKIRKKNLTCCSWRELQEVVVETSGGQQICRSSGDGNHVAGIIANALYRKVRQMSFRYYAVGM